ncbi:MAG: 23S rRNA (guanosine(2251)-2'-O)-methyltransferase RlmB [Melioribacter sp.]|nr:23S rRNA (guanosine(2251)-2'-O)-methyltransferase RlmB [Melioribacter sp.]
MNKIFGRKPVLEAINAGVDLEVIYVAYGQHGDVIHKIFNSAKERGIKITQISQQKFNELARSENAQGVIAVKSVATFYELSEIIEHAKKSTYPLLLLLDSIQDPHNLGAILRTAECSGVDGILITTNQSSPITETVEKISAGAVSHLKICKVNNLVRAIEQLKKENFWIVGSSLSNSKNYTSIDYKMPVALVVGNEEKGIRKLVAENCDFLVKIPMPGKIDSLNVSVATGVLLFEILRQQKS